MRNALAGAATAAISETSRLREYACCNGGTHAATGTLVALSGRGGAIFGSMSAQPTM